MEVIRLTPIHAHLFEYALIHELFAAAFPEDSLVIRGGFDGHEDELRDVVLNMQDTVGLFIGVEDDEFLAVSLVFAPDPSKLMQTPTIMHFYNRGSNKLRRALVQASVDFVKSKGHMTVQAVNATERPDSVWARTFRSFGESKKVGSIMEVDLR